MHVEPSDLSRDAPVQPSMSAVAAAFLPEFSRAFPGFQTPEFLGEGGQSVVFKALDDGRFEKSEQKWVAVKVLGLKGHDDSRTDQELDTVARLTSRCEETDDARRHRVLSFTRAVRADWEGKKLIALVNPYFAQGTLYDWRSRQTKVRAEDLVRIVSDIADGLSLLHEWRLVHRDLKPTNVFMEFDLREPSLVRAVLGDFGCTRPVRIATSTLTLDYAPVDPRESGPEYDVASLGFVTAYLIRGREDALRFDAGAGRGAVNLKIFGEAKTHGTIEGVDSDWHDDVATLVAKATHADPGVRGSPGDFARQLRERTEIASKSLVVRSVRRIRRYWIPVLLATIVLTGALLVLASRFVVARPLPDFSERLLSHLDGRHKLDMVYNVALDSAHPTSASLGASLPNGDYYYLTSELRYARPRSAFPQGRVAVVAVTDPEKLSEWTGEKGDREIPVLFREVIGVNAAERPWLERLVLDLSSASTPERKLALLRGLLDLLLDFDGQHLTPIAVESVPFGYRIVYELPQARSEAPWVEIRFASVMPRVVRSFPIVIAEPTRKFTARFDYSRIPAKHVHFYQAFLVGSSVIARHDESNHLIEASSDDWVVPHGGVFIFWTE
jgi:serine/threonine protein kinase